MFQRFTVVMEYQQKPVLPPPFIAFCHFYSLLKYCCRKAKGNDKGWRGEWVSSFICYRNKKNYEQVLIIICTLIKKQEHNTKILLCTVTGHIFETHNLKTNSILFHI